MGFKAALGGIGLMLIGMGLPPFFHISWGWGGIVSFLGLCLLFLSCSGWIFGGSPEHLHLGRAANREVVEKPNPEGPKIIMQLIEAAQFSTYQLTARSADAFEIEVPPLTFGDGTVGWSLLKTVLLNGESMPATIHEIGKSGNLYQVGQPRLLELAMGRLVSPWRPIVERSIVITYRDDKGRQWQTECPIRYDKHVGKAQFLTPTFSLRVPSTAIATDQKTLEALQKLLPNEGGIMQLRGRAQIFKWDTSADAALANFVRFDAGAHNAFLDEDLESLRQKLHSTINLLLDRAYRYTDDDSRGQPRGFTYQQNDTATYDSHRNEVIELTQGVVKTYDDLILTARRKFLKTPSPSVLRPQATMIFDGYRAWRSEYTFGVPHGTQHLTVVFVKNNQLASGKPLHNAIARIDYLHDGSPRFTVQKAMWLEDRRGVGRSWSVDLEANESQCFPIFMQGPALKCPQSAMSEELSSRDLVIGRWTARITITADFCDPLKGEIEFTVLQNQGSDALSIGSQSPLGITRLPMSNPDW